MEITFTRVVSYTADVSGPKDQRSLAKALGITPRRLEILAEEGELFDESDRCDAVAEWLTGRPDLVSVTEEEDMEELEITF